MATTNTITIPWTTGSGNIYIKYTGSLGDQTLAITTDANSLTTARSQNLTFTYGKLTKTLTIKQSGAAATTGKIYYAADSDLTNSKLYFYCEDSFDGIYIDGIDGDYADLNDPCALYELTTAVLNCTEVDNPLCLFFQTSSLSKISSSTSVTYEMTDSSTSEEIASGEVYYDSDVELATISDLQALLNSGHDIYIKMSD